MYVLVYKLLLNYKCQILIHSNKSNGKLSVCLFNFKVVFIDFQVKSFEMRDTHSKKKRDDTTTKLNGNVKPSTLTCCIYLVSTYLSTNDLNKSVPFILHHLKCPWKNISTEDLRITNITQFSLENCQVVYSDSAKRTLVYRL